MMKRFFASLMMLAFALVGSDVLAQSGGKVGIGINAGVRKIYGDRAEENLGVGGGGFISYRALPFANFSLGLGYNQLKFNFVPGTSGSTSDMLNVDLKGNLEIISKGPFRPYVTLGAGLLSSQVRNSGFGRQTAGAFWGGGGFRIRVAPKIDLFLDGDYRFSTTDRLDNNIDEGTAKDGYFSVNSGFVYSLGSANNDLDVIADERAPFYQLEGDADFSTQEESGVMSMRQTGGGEEKNMEEYVKLKSRIDRLNGDVDAHEQEIADLQNRLSQGKTMLSALEQRTEGKSSITLNKNSSMSGFSEIYEQALTNFYNKEYSEAISLFRLLLQQYSNHSLASSCQYWVGQSLFAMNQYQAAIDEFYKVLSFERSLKKDDALFLLGKSYLKIGSGDRARESFVRLMRDFPKSEYIEEAKGYIAKL